jgi:Rrf2 family protein
MALISTKGTYGLIALYQLSKNGVNHPMTISDISQKADVPKSYLEQLLPKLKKIGIVKSLRGAQGGYLLAKDPKEIKVLQILEALEGGMRIVDERSTSTMLKLYFDDVQKRLYEIFDITLEDLRDYEDRLLEYIHYSI